MVHVQQPSSSSHYVPLPLCRWWLAEYDLFRLSPPFPRKTTQKGPFLCRHTIAVGLSSMHDCLHVGITWLFSFWFHLLALSLDTGAANIFFPGARSYQAALSSAEQYFFTLRKKSASLNICLTPWQLFDTTSTPLFTVEGSGRRHLYNGTLSFASKALFPGSSFPVSLHIRVLSPVLSSVSTLFPKPGFWKTAALRLVRTLQRLGSSETVKKERFFLLCLHQRTEVVA